MGGKIKDIVDMKSEGNHFRSKDAETIRPNLKVPGEVPPVGKMSHEVAKLKSELKSKTVQQLKEILQRQEKLLSNCKLVARLPDKGQKARDSIDAVKSLLEERVKLDSLSSELEKMKLTTEKMEWKNRFLDSDDDSDPEDCGPVKNPLAVLVEGELPSKKELDKRTNLHSSKVDNLPAQERFIPFKTSDNSCVDDVDENSIPLSKCKSKSSKPSTPAIPLPPSYTCKTQQISLQESLSIQIEQTAKQREALFRRAQEKIVENSGTSNQVKVLESLKELGSDLNDDKDDEGDINDCDASDDENSDEEGHGVVGITQLVEDN